MSGNSIHPSAVVGVSVRLGAGGVVGPGAVLAGPTVVGDDTWLGAHVVIGSPPEVRGHPHTPDWIDTPDGYGVRIGSRTIIREGSQVHGGWKATTCVGDDVFVMNQCYVAHDCRLDDGVTLSSNVALGGHVHVGAHATLGMGVVVHQFRTVGAFAMVGMGAVVSRDVPPFVKAYGNPSRTHGVNVVGMRRHGFSDEAVTAVEAAVATGDAAAWAALADLPELAAYLPARP